MQTIAIDRIKEVSPNTHFQQLKKSVKIVSFPLKKALFLHNFD
jgi:hypothetical protein